MKHTLINNVDEKPAAPPCGVPRREHATRNEDAEPVSVNGVVIEESEIAREAQHHPARTATESRAMAARALVIRALLLDRASELGLRAEEQADVNGRRETAEEALIRQVIEREAEIATPTEEECRRYYQAALTLQNVPFDVAAPRIRDQLSARAWVTGSSRYVSALARRAKVEGVEL